MNFPAAPGSPREKAVKRGFDLIVAIALLVLAFPLLLVISLLVLVCDGRPVFHREQRIGRHGKPFTLYKFRSMSIGAPGEETVAPDDDPRITALGRFLRRQRLDELPQLIHIASGRMSLVGPRPLRQSHLRTLGPTLQGAILSVRPGLTGPAAVDFLAEDTVLAGRASAQALYLNHILPAKAAREVEYLKHWSLRADFLLAIKTAAHIWSRAARTRSARMVGELIAASAANSKR